jgi:hypothetical protein
MGEACDSEIGNSAIMTIGVAIVLLQNPSLLI